MRYIFICLCFLLFQKQSVAQKNPCNLSIVSDRLSSSQTAYTPVFVMSNGEQKMNLSFYRSGSSIVLSVRMETTDLFCIDNTSKAIIHFADQPDAIMPATNTSNCTGTLQSLMKDNTTQLQIASLKDKTIDYVKVVGKNTELEFKTSPADAKRIRTYFKCLHDLNFQNL